MAQDWLPVKEFSVQMEKVVSPRRIRSLLMDRKNKGTDSFVRKIGGSVYMSPSLFYEWVESGKGSNV